MQIREIEKHVDNNAIAIRTEKQHIFRTIVAALRGISNKKQTQQGSKLYEEGFTVTRSLFASARASSCFNLPIYAAAAKILPKTIRRAGQLIVIL